jgi:hypothetical protein
MKRITLQNFYFLIFWEFLKYSYICKCMYKQKTFITDFFSLYETHRNYKYPVSNHLFNRVLNQMI